MKKTVKVLTVILAVAFLVTSFLAGCGSKSVEAPKAEAPKAEAPGTEAVKAEEPKTDAKKIKVGYVVNQMAHEWYQNIIAGGKAEAEKLGYEFVIADSNMDVNTQVNACENFVAQKVDALIITPIDPKAVAPVVKKAKAAGIKVISESNVIEGADTFVGISNKAGAKNVGKWYAEYAKANNITPKVLIVGLPAYQDCSDRVACFKEALQESGIKYEIAQEVDGQGNKEKALAVSTDALTANKDVNCIFGINDDSTTGGMAAYKAAGLDEKKLVAIGFGFEGKVGQEALLSGGPYKAACAMFPNYVGVGLVDAAQALISGEKLPAHYETPTVAMTKDIFDNFYKKDGDKYQLDFEAVRALMKK